MSTRPVVTVHLAQSLDGRLAIQGQRTALSERSGLCLAHASRAAHDAVLVGASTVRIDDPRLTVRDAPGQHPLRVVLASTLSLPREARVLDADGRALVIGAEGRAIDTERASLEARGVAVAIAPRDDAGRVAIEGALAVLAERGVRSLLVEGGAAVITSFLRARRVDHMCIEIAMRLLGAPGTAMLGALGVAAIDEAPSLTNVTVERAGESVLVRGDVLYA
ncbi:MAG: Diaminohydroxyphosphoribosylaminopyrimidine deaminase [Labilithrix sp.]|nr:Diaminohydroxyphosphoribosylaminopyrimidine deaminase [Labilithrix sp.]